MNKKNMKVWFIATFLYIAFFSVAFGSLIYTDSKKVFYEKTAGLIGAGVNYDSRIEKTLVSSLKNKNEKDINKGKEILRQYGYAEEFKFNFNRPSPSRGRPQCPRSEVPRHGRARTLPRSRS